jgi:hypothetical protein
MANVQNLKDIAAFLEQSGHYQVILLPLTLALTLLIIPSYSRSCISTARRRSGTSSDCARRCGSF